MFVCGGVSAATTNVGDYDALTNAVSSASSGDTIKITADINVGSTITIDKNLTLTAANDAVIYRDATWKSQLFSVGSDVTLTIDGAVIDGNRDKVKASKCMIEVQQGGRLLMMSGELRNNNTSSGPGAVNIVTGTFDMIGGAIHGNGAGSDAAAVKIKGKSSSVRATMSLSNDAKIENNTSTKYGAIFIDYYSDVVMNGGLIASNVVTTSYGGGGGVYLNSYSTFTQNGGMIVGNVVSQYYGGGIHANGGVLKLIGGEVTGNTITKTSSSSAYGGGIYVGSYAKFEMTGCAIYGNGGEVTIGGTTYGKYMKETMGFDVYDNGNTSATSTTSFFVTSPTFTVKGITYRFHNHLNISETGEEGYPPEYPDQRYYDNYSIVRKKTALTAVVYDHENDGHHYANAGVAATCTTDGWSEYKCVGCDETYGNRVETPAFGHKPVTSPAYPEGCWYDDEEHQNHYRLCQTCGERYDVGEHTIVCGSGRPWCTICELNSTSSLPVNRHSNASHVAAKEPTETANGNKEYYLCGGCERYFLDQDGTKETTYDQIILPKLGAGLSVFVAHEATVPIAMPFGNESGVVSWQDVLDTDALVGSDDGVNATIIKVPIGNQYASYYLNKSKEWVHVDGTPEVANVKVGDSIWLANPKPKDSMLVVLMGQVPESDNRVEIKQGANLVCFPTKTDVPLNDVKWDKAGGDDEVDSVTGDRIETVNPADGKAKFYHYSATGKKWIDRTSPTGGSPTIVGGQGFFYIRKGEDMKLPKTNTNAN